MTDTSEQILVQNFNLIIVLEYPEKSTMLRFELGPYGWKVNPLTTQFSDLSLQETDQTKNVVLLSELSIFPRVKISHACISTFTFTFAFVFYHTINILMSDKL